jgi:hypothetical protein
MAAKSKSSHAISCVSLLKITNIWGAVSVPNISVTMGTGMVPETSVTMVDRPRRFYPWSDVCRDNAVIQELPEMDGCRMALENVSQTKEQCM